MSKIKVGILKEGKIPVDKRTPITPEQSNELKTKFPDIELFVQKSSIRCFPDKAYFENGIEVVDDLSQCNILLGVKEVPVHELIADKTYFFFSHTYKEQPHNRKLLREILKKRIRLIDYECLTTPGGHRIVAFGRFAGIVGAYNGILTFGKRYNLFNLRRAHECHDLEDLKKEFTKINLPSVKIVLTGGGRVAKGAMEVLLGMNVLKVSPHNFLHKTYKTPVFTQLNARDYNKHKEGKSFVREEFYKYPERYEGDFLKYTTEADILIAGAYWDPEAPVLFHKEDILKKDFKIKVIADITCDIEGSIPSTKRPCTIEDPVYDYNPSQDKIEAPFQDEANISVMAIDNLPGELPRDASKTFGRDLIDRVFPYLFGKDEKNIIQKATIAENGKLTKYFKYLKDYVEGK